MVTRRPRLRVESLRSGDSSAPPSSFIPVESVKEEAYALTSIFRSLQMEIHIQSPSVKTLAPRGQEIPRTLPVFGDSDLVGGKIVVAQDCSQSGRVTVSIEGAFQYVSPKLGKHFASSPSTEDSKLRHVFFSSSTVIPLSASSETGGSRSALNIRDAFVATVRRVERRPSLPSLTSTSGTRSFSFGFQLPRSSRSGEELPPTFSFSALMEGGMRNRAFAENAEVSYRVTALWEANNGSGDRIFLEAPILFQPDTDFSSLDALSMQPASWLEMPLRAERPIPFRCAITLPSPAAFPRSGSIPYFVVFTTTPRSSSLAKEIASDATVTVSLIRRITVNALHSGLPPTPPPSPLRVSDDSGYQSPVTPTSMSSKLLKRVVKSAPPIMVRTPSQEIIDREPSSYVPPNIPPDMRHKPLPPPPSDALQPAKSFSETRTLQTDVSIGFPKRPRASRSDRNSSTESHTALPDGLYKGRMNLNKYMIPGIDWAGLTVKYYLEVSVLVGGDDVRARVPIRLC
ncbi:hypothetical protein JAAARDRAFT_176742 [Jaapia argillacea MUCL 33604]|uniref:Uncharacterized protein n=1 Tax=Jaapia argillacea MUCL 33604 TaxID=933084 RepID=A0A067PV37_9AGAM|nr:hypothetical protein JAAARDRAFT_176742 [Jaapia argillacea MUCL 33604]